MKKLALLSALAAAQSVLAHNLLRFPTVAANNETVTIGAVTYTFKTSPAAVATEVDHGADAAASRANLLAKINANQDDASIAVAVTNGLLVLNGNGHSPLATTETLAGANNGWAAATMFGGRAVDTLKASVLASRAATAVEEAMELMVFPLTFTPTAFLVQVRTAAGAAKAWDGTATIVGNRIHLTSGGTTDIAATDVVTVLASA